MDALGKAQVDAKGRTPLLIGAGANFAIAILHVIIIVLGAPAYRYFGAAEFAAMAEAGSPVPALVTLALVGVFIGCGLYALSGAGMFRPLPLLTLGLLGIGSIYTLRGVILILDILRLLGGMDYPPRQAVFSAVALIIGLLYFVGTVQRWRDLHRGSVR